MPNRTATLDARVVPRRPPGTEPTVASTQGRVEQPSLPAAVGPRTRPDRRAALSRDGRDWCDARPDRPCRLCRSRRERAIALLAAHLDFDQLGRRLQLSLGQALVFTAAEQRHVERVAGELEVGVVRVERIVEQEIDARALTAYRGARTVPSAPLRRLLRQAELRDPALSNSELARRAGFRCPTELGRKLGRYLTPHVVKNGRAYGGIYKTAIDRADAERVIRALGYAPAELDELLQRHGRRG